MPILGILVLELILFLTNYTPGTVLAGWDNLMPEFNFWDNLQRNVFGVWLQYRGLGLFDGQSHAAATIHTLIIGLLSLLQPQALVRYTFTFGLHALGIIGMFYLVKELLSQRRSKHFTSALTALFYGFNPATIQIFYTPFEPFTVHFAALPWIAYGLLAYFNKNKRAWINLLIIFLLSTPQFFVPTLLIPTSILIASFSLMYMKTSAKQIVALGVGFLLINSFWLLPYLTGLHTTAPVIANAKINQMSSPDMYLRDRAFGDIKNIMLLRGFPLDFEDFNQNGTPIFIMANWKMYLELPVVQITSWIFASLSIIGLILTLLHRKKYVTPFIVSGMLAFILLATDTPITAEINTAIRTAIPFLGEGLRVPFTKFILLFVLTYSVFIAVSVDAVWEYLRKITFIQQGVIFALSVALCIMAFPSFLGDFISPLMRVPLPNEYRQTFAYFQKQPVNTRIAMLPQPAYWSWKLYQFGYHGSGFMWFGLPQPTMDRAFDPWSATNENYYWELSYALYSKNVSLLNNVFNKYDISYIVLDENILSFSNNRSLFTDETKELLAQIPDIKETAKFGKITVYKKTDQASNNFISIKSNLPTVNAYTWTDNDVAYTQLSDYITSSNPDITYPYRSLFTKRSVSERAFDINTLLPVATPVYDSTKSADLVPGNVKECGLLTGGAAAATMTGDGLQFQSLNQRGCLSFDIPTLSHAFGYLAAVESRHVTGRPLMISFINDTAKHVELEAYLSADSTEIPGQARDDNGWQTAYFILPPLAPDGLGYTVYVSNDSIGHYQTINELSRIRVYKIPYEQMVSMSLQVRTGVAAIPMREIASPAAQVRNDNNVNVSHPNPALYKIQMQNQNRSPIRSGMTSTIILSQSYNTGWIAYDMSSKKILSHVLVDNWENGWLLDSSRSNEVTNNELTVYIFFWPQILEFIGFALLPIPFFLRRSQAV